MRALLLGLLDRLDRRIEVRRRNCADIRTPALRTHLAKALRAHRRTVRASRVEAEVLHHAMPDHDYVPPYLEPHRPVEAFLEVKCAAWFDAAMPSRFLGRQAG